MVADRDLRERAYAAAAAVADPEIPVLSIADLGVLRDVIVQDGVVEVVITPTYTGCPAMHVIGLDIVTALAAAGIPDARVHTVLSPAWTTDWLSEDAHRKLAAYGIAPPERRTASPICPRCGGGDTELLSEFGSTACKSLHRCRVCREPFDAFKCH